MTESNAVRILWVVAQNIKTYSHNLYTYQRISVAYKKQEVIMIIEVMNTTAK